MRRIRKLENGTIRLTEPKGTLLGRSNPMVIHCQKVPPSCAMHPRESTQVVRHGQTRSEVLPLGSGDNGVR